MDNDITTVESLRLELSKVKEATNNFSINNKIGEGGFGEVYKVQSLKVEGPLFFLRINKIMEIPQIYFEGLNFLCII